MSDNLEIVGSFAQADELDRLKDRADLENLPPEDQTSTS